MTQKGKATTTKTTFSRTTEVRIDIQADPAIIWALLTNASDFPRWNSTIISLDGHITVGETIRLKVHLDPKRTFKIKVKEMQPEQRMVWGDGQGTRIFTLTPGDGHVTFHMHEKIGGLMFPLYARFLPDFNEAFETYAADLKREAEGIETAS